MTILFRLHEFFIATSYRLVHELCRPQGHSDLELLCATNFNSLCKPCCPTRMWSLKGLIELTRANRPLSQKAIEKHSFLIL